MINPEQTKQQLDVRTIYDYDNHNNIAWNMSEYHSPRLHFDQKAIIRQRSYAAQKKGVKDNYYYVTKRGFYMDYDLKQMKAVPSSAIHGHCEPWDGTHHQLEAEALKEVRNAKKYTYLERIEMRQEKHPVPGITTYPLEKSLSQIEAINLKNQSKKIKNGQKRYFHQDTSFLGDKSPGAGFYNPHESVELIHKSSGDWKTWTKKHQKIDKTMLMRSSKMPAPGTYSPISQEHKSFSALQSMNKQSLQKKNGFGSDSRFPYVRPNKKKIVEIRPAPCAYETKIEWKGKSVSPKKMEWAKMIWKGSPPKVY